MKNAYTHLTDFKVTQSVHKVSRASTQRLGWLMGDGNVSELELYEQKTSTQDRLIMLNRMNITRRQSFFEQLSKEYKKEILDYIDERNRIKREIKICAISQLSDILLSASTKVIMIMGLIDPCVANIIIKVKENNLEFIKRFGLSKKQLYKCSLPFDNIKEKYKNAIAFINKVDGGSITQHLSVDLQSMSSEYELTGLVSYMLQRKIYSLWKDKYISKLHEECIIIAEKNCPKYKDLLGYLYLAYILTQCADVISRKHNIMAKETYDEAEDKMHTLFTEDGMQYVKRTKNSFIHDKPIMNLCVACEQMIESVTNRAVKKDVLNDCNKTINEFIEYVLSGSDIMLLKDIIDECRVTYNRWYVAKIVQSTITGATIKDKVKEEVNNVFGNCMGWCRLMKDVRSIIRDIHYNENDDIQDLMDSINERALCGKTLHAYNTFLTNLEKIHYGEMESKYRLYE